jgi:hypothetical protein
MRSIRSAGSVGGRQPARSHPWDPPYGLPLSIANIGSTTYLPLARRTFLTSASLTLMAFGVEFNISAISL